VSQDRWDFVIVGGGSAGCVLANRLSADRSTRVLVLEAGRWDSLWDPFIHMPAALSVPVGKRAYDWRYESEPEPHMDGRKVYHARGKLLGGSSSINGMIFQRGNPLDYERWATVPGLETWDYAHCLPYFKRMERCLAGPNEWRGGDGPIVLERGAATNPLCKAFFAAGQQAGYEISPDVNGARQEGLGHFDRTIYRGRRMSAARTYLHPVIDRPNLKVRCRSLVSRVLFKGTRATGVEVVRSRGTEIVQAGEVILSGGAYNSPQVLQLSGVGNAEGLSALDIDVIQELPGVGENLQDHLEVFIQHACSKPVSLQPALKASRKPGIFLKWVLFRSGAGATNHFESGGFVRSNDELAYPNVMFHFLPLAVRYAGAARPASGHGYQLHVMPGYSDGRGSVKIVSRDPRVHPALRFNYLSTERDRAEWVEAVRCGRTVLSQPAFEPYDAGETSPGSAVQSDEEILEWVARDAETGLHPSGTCRLGRDTQSVIDPASMRVHGIDGLRVVDASVLPCNTNANIYAPTMMVAERAADLILMNTPLPPIELEFFKREPAVDGTSAS
jgi:choline dehydrogenase